MDNPDQVADSIYKKIEREKALIAAANQMRQSTQNQQVLSRLETQIRDGRRNIDYFEGRLRELEMRKLGNSMDNTHLGNNREPSPPQHGVPAKDGYNQPYARAGEYGAPGPAEQYSQLSGGNIPMPPSKPFAQPGPGSSGMPKSRPNYSRLGTSSGTQTRPFTDVVLADLIKYDTPHLGPRIQLMLSQLEFKLSVEKQYKDGIDKMARLYQLEGDRKSKADAEARRLESNQKMQLLKQALKRYEDLHVDIEGMDGGDGKSFGIDNRRRGSVLTFRHQMTASISLASANRSAVACLSEYMPYTTLIMLQQADSVEDQRLLLSSRSKMSSRAAREQPEATDGQTSCTSSISTRRMKLS
jgi:hypothetical protein